MSSLRLSRDKSMLPEVAYTESTRAIEQQQGVLDNLRTRAGTVFSAGSVAVAFLAGIALDGRGMPWQGWVGVGGYVALLGLTSWVLYPMGDLHFAFSAKVLLDDRGCAGAWASLSNEDMYRQLALNLEDDWDRNWKRIKRRLRVLGCAVVALGVDVGIWLVVLAWR